MLLSFFLCENNQIANNDSLMTVGRGRRGDSAGISHSGLRDSRSHKAQRIVNAKSCLLFFRMDRTGKIRCIDFYCLQEINRAGITIMEHVSSNNETWQIVYRFKKNSNKVR
jgi:hypothetical protein